MATAQQGCMWKTAPRKADCVSACSASPTHLLEYPILKRSVRGQFLKYGPLERRVMVKMFGEEPSELSIPVRSLSELMEHLVHKVLILRAPCHKLLPQCLITENPIHPGASLTRNLESRPLGGILYLASCGHKPIAPVPTQSLASYPPSFSQRQGWHCAIPLA